MVLVSKSLTRKDWEIYKTKAIRNFPIHYQQAIEKYGGEEGWREKVKNTLQEIFRP